ncbi:MULTISPECIES: hypothetical protein [unclassified Streptomyces]|uniref:hypothetical protein n=1 Tax=unclassified Streptomyces TaxID=2593676 RepID=UPI002E2F15AA|nr:hypothetical protein [Streptomyces sp. NBC_01268]
MSHHAEDGASAPGTARPREQVRRTRDEHGRTVAVPAGKADVTAQARERAHALKEQAAGAATLVADRLRTTVAQAAEVVKDKTPDPLVDRAAHAAARVRHGKVPAGYLTAVKIPDQVRARVASAGTTARSHRAPVLAAAAATIAVLLFLRRNRRPQ